MPELDDFEKSLSEKSLKTKITYMGSYAKLIKLLGKDIADASQETIIDSVTGNFDNINTIQALLNIGLLVRRLYGLAVDKIQNERAKNVKLVEKHTKVLNLSRMGNLPTFEELLTYTDDRFENNEWTDFIINYLLLHTYVRNKDLNFTIVLRKKDMKDQNTNYIWYDVRHKKALFVRRDYKTSATYGEKRTTINDTKFLLALKRVYDCQRKDQDCGVFIPNENQVGYYIKKATYEGIGEANYLKIIIQHHISNKGDAQVLKEIASSRGTDIKTLLNNYDPKNV